MELAESPERPEQIVKCSAIVKACQDHSIGDLISLANSEGGLLKDELRRSAWPQLLNCRGDEKHDRLTDSWQSLPAHRDEEQVQKDVDRAFVYYPNNQPAKVDKARRDELYALIVSILRSHPMLCYFQGYHDIVQVLLLVLGKNVALPAVARISLLRIRDYMLPSLGPAITHLRLIPVILQSADPELAQHLSQTAPYFALSGTLTLYAHDIQEYGDISRLFDFILANEPIMTIYLYAAIIICRRSELLALPADEPDMLHFVLSKLPQPPDLEAYIRTCLLLFSQVPPEKLPGRTWKRLSSSSVLKTSRLPHNYQSLGEAEAYFYAQEARMRREKLMESTMKLAIKHRTRLLVLGGSVIVGILAYWIQKTGNYRSLSSMVSRGWCKLK